MGSALMFGPTARCAVNGCSARTRAPEPLGFRKAFTRPRSKRAARVPVSPPLPGGTFKAGSSRRRIPSTSANTRPAPIY